MTSIYDPPEPPDEPPELTREYLDAIADAMMSEVWPHSDSLDGAGSLSQDKRRDRYAFIALAVKEISGILEDSKPWIREMFSDYYFIGPEHDEPDPDRQHDFDR